jgi:hypothetical protein
VRSEGRLQVERRFHLVLMLASTAAASVSCGRAVPVDVDAAADGETDGDDHGVPPPRSDGGRSDSRSGSDAGPALDGTAVTPRDAPAADALTMNDRAPDVALGPEGPPAVPCPAPPFGAEPQSRTWLAYEANPNTHPNIPNVSYAGYRNGETLLPAPEGPLINVKDHGAQGDGRSDDTAAIRRALQKALESIDTGAVVYFPNGTYVLTGVLFVHSNRTVLRGQSRAGTRLLFTQPLSKYATNQSPDGTSRWNWLGGLVWFTPVSRTTYVPPGTNLSNSSDGWASGSDIASVTAPAARGESAIKVSSTNFLRAGQFVLLRLEAPSDFSLFKHLVGDGPWADRYEWSLNAGRFAMENVRWPVQIAAVSGDQVTLKQPLRFDLKPEWKPRLQPIVEPILDSGIESMTLMLYRTYSWTTNTPDTIAGWNGLYFNNVINAFARGITIVDSEVAIATASVKNVTLTDIRIAASNNARLEQRHGILLRNQTNDVLVDRFEIASKPVSGIRTEHLSMGNVWSRGTMQHGTFDSGQILPSEEGRTEIKIFNDGRSSLASGKGPFHGARMVNWNVEVTNNVSNMVCEAQILPRGALVGVRGCGIMGPFHKVYGDSQCVIENSGFMGTIPNPRNLYEAQRWLRLCKTP